MAVIKGMGSNCGGRRDGVRAGGYLSMPVHLKRPHPFPVLHIQVSKCEKCTKHTADCYKAMY